MSQKKSALSANNEQSFWFAKENLDNWVENAKNYKQ